MSHSTPIALLIILLASASVGCASTPYAYGTGLGGGSDIESASILPLRPGEEQIERGRPHALLDGLGHYLFSLPAKILLLNWKVDNHDISEETEAGIREYLDANGLCHVKVRINQYAPGDEWSRLARNRDMPGIWRWTLGAATVAFYTILPNRLLGGDHYNPFTNTISLFSDSQAIALHEAGHAKDFAGKESRHWKGGYAALRLLPLVPLWQEAAASNDAISWVHERGSAADEKQAYRTLYPAYTTYIGGEVGNWYSTPWTYAAVIPGHIVGWLRSFSVEDRERPELEPLDPGLRLELGDRSCGRTTADPADPAHPGDPLEPGAEWEPLP